MADLNGYKGILPYASELFGIYQPLLGWKSKRIQIRYDAFRFAVLNRIADRVLAVVKTPVKVQLDSERLIGGSAAHFAAQGIRIEGLRPILFMTGAQPYLASKIDTAVARLLQTKIGSQPPTAWSDFVNFDTMTRFLGDVQTIVTTATLMDEHAEVADYVKKFVANAVNQDDKQAILQAMFERESSISGYMTFLAQHFPSTLTSLFFRGPAIDVGNALVTEDPLLNFGENQYRAILSPIGIIHLYREYFFEFDSFLGPPVGHVWLSPGGTVELIEINTRKVFTERSVESMTETTTTAETSVTNQDEIADAVKEENSNDTKLGVSNVATGSSPFFQDTATVSLSLDNAKANSRETTHKRMRQQSEKLSSEIKKNFKTTFKTSTEVTDTTSKRYVIQNTTDKLVNYELRRKMRKVGVQVQDIGTQMCWHTFVDDPGRHLGVSKLVHIAQAADLSDLADPDLVERPVAVPQEVNINVPFIGIGDTDDADQAYQKGIDDDDDDFIQWLFPQTVFFDKSGYTLSDVTFDSQGNDVQAGQVGLLSDEGSSTGSFTLFLDSVNFKGQQSVSIKATLLWSPGAALLKQIDDENAKRLSATSAEKARRFKEAFYKAARERIKLASQISPRPAEDLREEERTVVYRSLINQLMQVGTTESKHVISELVRSIFDVDKMLYFVTPEWWAPRQHLSVQHLGEPTSTSPSGSAASGTSGAKAGTAIFNLGSGVLATGLAGSVTASASGAGTPIPAEDIVDWGGGKEIGRSNYYITEDSTPAKLGSSLGWLLQLDGDNLRNAMLNSPWVKAVIPIRLGKEQQAINWLQQAHVEGSDGLDAKYVAAPDDPPELQPHGGHTPTVREALDFLIGKIQECDAKSRAPIMPNPADPEDPRNHFAGSLPTEAVFEHGFYPLQGGVKFNQDGTEQAIFSQWMEILPTDQVAALAVEYDPKTLQIKDPDAS
jgi:hypothetical protein